MNNNRHDSTRGTPLSRAMTYSLILLMGLFGISVCFLVWATINLAISTIQDDYMDGLRLGVETEISTFMDDHRAIITDLAKYPVVIQGVMQPEVARDNLADFLDAASLIGTRCQLVVLDYRGSIIYMTQSTPEYSYQECDYVTSLLEQNVEFHTSISRTASESFWRIAVPINYNGMTEGILVAEIPLNLINKANIISDHLSTCQIEFVLGNDVIASFGPTIDSVPETSHIENIGLDLKFYVDRGSVANDLLFLFGRLVAILIGLTLIFLIIGVTLIRKVLIEPLNQLRDWTTALGDSLDIAKVETLRIREIATLASNFENMVDRLRTRDTALRKAHSTLELRVKERTQDLEIETKRLELILRGIGDGVIVTDIPFHIILINQVAKKVLGGLAERYCLGQNIGKLFVSDSEENQISEKDFINKLSGNSGEFIWTINHPKTSFLNVSYSMFDDESGTPAGYVLTLRGVTAEQKVNRMKTDFVSSVYLELRTPLTSIKGFTSTLIRDQKMPLETRQRFLGIIDKESTRLTNLIDDLLEISIIESGKMRFDLTSVDMEKLAARALDSMSFALDENCLLSNIECAEDANLVLCDAQKTQTLVTNLLGNAIKFTPPGGMISLVIENVGEFVALKISDTGIGIPEDELTKIYDRFYRGTRPGLEVTGTGLGLAIVKQFVTQQNGSIDVVSEVGNGTTFTVQLPVNRDNMA